MQRAAGYSLTGLTTERVLFVLHGVGRNGKSTLLETLREVLGDYATVAPTELLLVRRAARASRTTWPGCKGARFVTAAETDEGRRLAEGVVKAMTGGDTITARFLHAEFFDFRPQFKLWLSTNHKPVIRGTDAGIWDRIRLIPFTVRIPDEEVDPDLPAKLRAEAPGILNWLLAGPGRLARARARRPRRPSWPPPRATARRWTSSGAFLDEACLEGPQLRATAKALYGAYSAVVRAHRRARRRTSGRSACASPSAASARQKWGERLVVVRRRAARSPRRRRPASDPCDPCDPISGFFSILQRYHACTSAVGSSWVTWVTTSRAAACEPESDP